MEFKISQFFKSMKIPYKGPGSLEGIYAFALSDRHKLIGPVPVVIKQVHKGDLLNKRGIPEGELYIEIDNTIYYEIYGDEYWGQAGYFLVFKTEKELKNESEFVLIKD